jgi:hypothetical protein
MAVTNGYATLVEARERMSISDSGDDNLLETVITAASRWIDDHTGRRFYSGTATRLYTASSPYSLAVDELTAVTTLKTDEDGDRVYETTWATTDYYLLPLNAVADGTPYDRIEVDQVSGTRRFPTGVPGGIQLVAAFGYGASGAPPLVKEACLRLVERFYSLRTAPLGVTGTAELGTLRIVSDRDVQDWLSIYVKRRRFA